MSLTRLMSAFSPMLDMKAILLPSGDHRDTSTSNSPLVSCLGFPPTLAVKMWVLLPWKKPAAFSLYLILVMTLTSDSGFPWVQTLLRNRTLFESGAQTGLETPSSVLANISASPPERGMDQSWVFLSSSSYPRDPGSWRGTGASCRPGTTGDRCRSRRRG